MDVVRSIPRDAARMFIQGRTLLIRSRSAGGGSAHDGWRGVPADGLLDRLALATRRPEAADAGGVVVREVSVAANQRSTQEDHVAR